MRTKEVVILIVTVLLFTSLVVVVKNGYATKEAEIAKRQLQKGDTLSEVLSSFTSEQIKHDKYLSKLLAKYEQEREDEELERDVDRSINLEGEDAATKTKKDKEAEKGEFIADIEDDLEDAKDDVKEAKTELQKVKAESEVDRIEKLLEYYKEKLD